MVVMLMGAPAFAFGDLALASIELGSAGALVALGFWAPQRRQRYALFGGAAALVAAAIPPMQWWASTSMTGHMVQHVVLVVVAAPLIATGCSWLTRRLRGVARVVGRSVRAPMTPIAAAAAHLAVLWAWHVPAWYDAALARPWLHLTEHVSLFATGVWWWAAVLHQGPRRNPLPAIASLMTVATGGAALGALLMFAPAPLFSIGDLPDQQQAGAVMAFTGAVYGAAALFLVARSLGGTHQMPGQARAVLARRARSARPVVVFVATAGTFALAMAAPRAEGGGSDAAAFAAATRSVDETAAVGRELYRRDCAACHGPSGEGSRFGIPIDEVGAAGVFYVLSTGRMPIPHPNAAIGRSDPLYTSDETDAIVEYSRRFVDGPDLPRTDIAVDLARGGELYRLHCAACHSSTGIGGAQAFGREAPPVLRAEPAEVVAAIVVGPGGMPGFSATLDETDIASVSAYVELLRDPPRTGIAVPGSRVAEGLVGWLVGVGALLLVAGWIGARR